MLGRRRPERDPPPAARGCGEPRREMTWPSARPDGATAWWWTTTTRTSGSSARRAPWSATATRWMSSAFATRASPRSSVGTGSPSTGCRCAVAAGWASGSSCSSTSPSWRGRPRWSRGATSSALRRRPGPQRARLPRLQRHRPEAGRHADPARPPRPDARVLREPFRRADEQPAGPARHLAGAAERRLRDPPPHRHRAVAAHAHRARPAGGPGRRRHEPSRRGAVRARARRRFARSPIR